jgi:ABC-type transport system involved in multi-copper enzyme maturation permease subunit
MSDAIMNFAILNPTPVRTIAAKDMRDALRDRFILIVAAFLGLAALVALVTGAIALRNDVATYEAAKASLLALGKSADTIKAPEFYPLRLLRGAIEQIEIIGAAIAILIGYRSASSERGRQTLALMLTRPMRRWQFVAGKALAGIFLLAGGLALVLGGLALMLQMLSGIGLVADDLLRITIVWAVAVMYTTCFFLVSFIVSLHMKHPSHALLVAFAVWLTLVLMTIR